MTTIITARRDAVDTVEQAPFHAAPLGALALTGVWASRRAILTADAASTHVAGTDAAVRDAHKHSAFTADALTGAQHDGADTLGVYGGRTRSHISVFGASFSATRPSPTVDIRSVRLEHSTG